jgi:hypothetical protein
MKEFDFTQTCNPKKLIPHNINNLLATSFSRHTQGLTFHMSSTQWQGSCQHHKNHILNFFFFFFFLQYIKRMTKLGILFTCDTITNLIGYVDVDWARDLEIWWSTFGMIFKFGFALMIWSSKLQPMVAFSNIEPKYQSLSDGTKKIIWLRSLYSKLQILNSRPIVMFVDNQSNIRLVKNPIFHAHTKHIKT